MGLQLATHAPDDGRKVYYKRHDLGGAEVFVHVSLMQTSPEVRVELSGWWVFKGLRVYGLIPAAQACMVPG